MNIEQLINVYLNIPAIQPGKTEIQIIDKRNDSTPCVFILKEHTGIIISPDTEKHLGISFIEDMGTKKACWEHVAWLWGSDLDKYQKLLFHAKQWLSKNTVERDSYHYFAQTEKE